MINRWNQGFDNKDNQVWGATEEPYILKKY